MDVDGERQLLGWSGTMPPVKVFDFTLFPAFLRLEKRL